MGQNCKECFQLLLSADIDNNSVDTVIKLFKDFLNNSKNYTAEDMLYILSIINYFDSVKITTKLLDLYMDEVKIHIRRLLTEYLLSSTAVKEEVIKPVEEGEKSVKPVQKVDMRCCGNDDVYEDFEGFIIKKKYTPGQNLSDTFKLPLEGQTANLKIKDEILDPDYIYFSEVEIDWQGNVLNYITAPKKIARHMQIQEVDFDEIYHELLTDIHEYVERPVV